MDILKSELAEMLEQARAEERERCARIAESVAIEHGQIAVQAEKARNYVELIIHGWQEEGVREVAAAIRAGGEDEQSI